MRILFLSRWFPYPPDNGSKLRIFNILRQLSREHEVGLIAFRETSETAVEMAAAVAERHCSLVRTVPYRAFQPTAARALLGLAAAQPRYLVATFSQDMGAAVAAEFERGRYDLVLASQLSMVPYALPLVGTPRLLEELELATFRDPVRQGRTALHRWRAALTWLKLRAYLRRSLPAFSACTVVSAVERDNLRAVVPDYASVRVVPNAVDVERYAGQFAAPRPNALVFCGALSYGPNYQGLRFFLQEVFPLLARALPDVTLRVTGDTGGVDLSSLPRWPGVEYTGYLEDVRSTVAESWASVVPLRTGGGTRLKILEAMALGTPVVATAKGAEGLDVRDGEDILLADDPAQFAQRVLALLRSPEMRNELSAAGRRLVAAKYDWRLVGRDLCALVQEIAVPAPAGERPPFSPLTSSPSGRGA